MIAIVNYGMGNLGSVANALDYLDCQFTISSDPRELAQADAYILPGVGAFPAAMENLNQLGIDRVLTEQVIEKTKPFLGICLGMQLIALSSEEHGGCKGLGWVDAQVIRFNVTSKRFPSPHVGWNSVEGKESFPLLKGIDNNAHFYFDHSYHMISSDKTVATAFTDYSFPVVAAICKDNIMATQFHPEKSQRNGLKLLRNFSNIAERMC